MIKIESFHFQTIMGQLASDDGVEVSSLNNTSTYAAARDLSRSNTVAWDNCSKYGYCQKLKPAMKVTVKVSEPSFLGWRLFND